jgi:thiol:disulfide interchange protein DsbA
MLRCESISSRPRLDMEAIRLRNAATQHFLLKESKEAKDETKESGTERFTAIAAAVLLASGNGWTDETDTAFPNFGTGPVEVRIYTNYHCPPPCRAMEPSLEPIVLELLRKNASRLILVDVPSGRLTPLFARNFLYALKSKKDIGGALRARNTLFEAAANRDISTQERIESLLRAKGIAWSVWDTKQVVDLYNTLLKEDKIKATPNLRHHQKKPETGICRRSRDFNCPQRLAA